MCKFPQNFHTKTLGEITVFYAVISGDYRCIISGISKSDAIKLETLRQPGQNFWPKILTLFFTITSNYTSKHHAVEIFSKYSFRENSEINLTTGHATPRFNR